jgi:hypothetical protein
VLFLGINYWVHYSTLTRISAIILHEWRQTLLLELLCKVSEQIFLHTVHVQCVQWITQCVTWLATKKY